jgi:hypothetical protein
MSTISSLSTILFSGAKLISLYLFSSKSCEKLTEISLVYAGNQQESSGVMSKLPVILLLFTSYKQVYPHSYPQLK